MSPMLAQYLADPPTVTERLTFGADAKGTYEVDLVTERYLVRHASTMETCTSHSIKQ